ncbi:hypothetical protein [Microbacterium aerolatum]|uniref:hypothetical protein n=1 Tax=Microbacterium aerolatum TaxID=153731 RepID=UPI00385013E1
MSMRAQSMALDTGTSSDADERFTLTGKARVRAAITVILTEAGRPLTDEEIVERYQARAGGHPSWPSATPQRIRTARAELVRAGQVRDAEILAFSNLGNRATAWTLT